MTKRNDTYARESFTWRRMQPWQIRTLAIIVAILVVIGVLYVA